MPSREAKGGVVASHRFKSIDWLRGLSVLFMIECHSLFFLRPEFEFKPDWWRLQSINGLVSVAFLFAAGFAAGLVGMRASKDAAARRQRLRRSLLRIGQVLALSVYLHIVNHPVFTQPRWFARVDILECIAIGLLMMWVIIAVCGPRQRLAIAVMATLWAVIFAVTPWAFPYHGGEIATAFLNGSNGSQFPIFPWTGYVMLGGIMGVLAAHPSLGRRRLGTGIGMMTAVGITLSLTPLGDAIWRGVNRVVESYPLSNAFERVWKVGAVCWGLIIIEFFATIYGKARWTIALRPVGATVNFFSRHALLAYFVHLAVLYGFWGIQFTQQWHRQSDWAQYWWRMPIVIVATAAICYAFSLAKASIAAGVRPKQVEPELATAQV